MKSSQGMSIRARLLLAFVGVLIPYLALIAIGVVGFRALTHRLHSIDQEVTQEIGGDVVGDVGDEFVVVAAGFSLRRGK